MASPRTLPGITAALTGAALLAACTGGSGDGQGRTAVVGPDIADTLQLPKADSLTAEYGPASVRVHPLSRWEGGAADGKTGPRAVVHIELIDSVGRGLTWPGVIIVTVGATQQAVDIRALADNAAAFDRVTRTYVVIFPNTERGNVRVRFRAAPAGAELRAEGVLREVGP